MWGEGGVVNKLGSVLGEGGLRAGLCGDWFTNLPALCLCGDWFSNLPALCLCGDWFSNLPALCLCLCPWCQHSWVPAHHAQRWHAVLRCVLLVPDCCQPGVCLLRWVAGQLAH